MLQQIRVYRSDGVEHYNVHSYGLKWQDNSSE